MSTSQNLNRANGSDSDRPAKLLLNSPSLTGLTCISKLSDHHKALCYAAVQCECLAEKYSKYVYIPRAPTGRITV